MQAMVGSRPVDANGLRSALAKRIMAAAAIGERDPRRLKLIAMGALDAKERADPHVIPRGSAPGAPGWHRLTINRARSDCMRWQGAGQLTSSFGNRSSVMTVPPRWVDSSSL